ncbi:helix-turn-helix domain-containing protein [Pedobacter cryophilus]|uniref:AraC family transcriptional regulator n=1 Tax=Pedobacter cryophilus TaxID=2571271 RepID=A0A4U1C1U4_9SPHI|nr:helix-turn-helix domain-containing protein [Pedobacter cryophilus]TKB98964.1 AraC family transcriptional regulator [Pedobacter cryophilus]
MLFEFNLYTSFLLIFFFHILVYAFLFFRRSQKQDNYADLIMGFFLIIGALLIVPFMVGFAGWYDHQPYRDILFFVPFVHSLAIGPLLYFYTRAISNYNFRIKGQLFLHLLPALIYLVITLINSLLDVFVYENYNLTNEYEDPDFAPWYTILSSFSILIYLFLSFKHYRHYKKFTQITTSFADLASLKWLRNFLYAFSILTILPFIKEILSTFYFFEKLRYFGPWYYYLAFAIVVYYIAINAYQAVLLPLRRIQFNPHSLAPYQLLENNNDDDEQEDILVLEPQIFPVNEKLIQLKAKLITLMEEQYLFERSDLTLTDVAIKLDTNAVILSKVVNQQFGLNFNDYVNQYRVNAVIKRIADPKFKNQTLLAIAFDAGFNSKATFNRAFKKFTGKNPKDYLSVA